MSVVRIKLRIGISMVSSVTSGPPLDRSLNGRNSSEGETVLKRKARVVRSMRPVAMVASGDTESREEVVDEAPDSGLVVPGDVVESVDGQGRRDGECEERDPLDVLQESTPCDGRKNLLHKEKDIVLVKEERRV